MLMKQSLHHGIDVYRSLFFQKNDPIGIVDYFGEDAVPLLSLKDLSYI